MLKPRNEAPRLSIVLPTLDEEKSVAKVMDDIKRYAAPYLKEIIIVDSSTDKTADIALQHGALVIKQPRQGPGKALIAGFHAASGNMVITADCDGTYPMEDIRRFIKLWREGYDFVNGNRLLWADRQAMPALNKIGNHFFARAVRLLFGVPVNDIASGMRLYDVKMLRSLTLETNYSLWIETIVKSYSAGWQFKEIPIKYRPRIGEVKMKPWRTCTAYTLCLLKYRWGLKFIDPQRIKWI